MFVIQQDLINTSIYARLKLTPEQRWGVIRRYDDKETAEKMFQLLLKDKSLDNKRCPLRLIEVPDGTALSGLATKDSK